MTWLERYTLPDSGVPAWAEVHAGCGLRLVTDGRAVIAADDPGATFGEISVRGWSPERSGMLSRVLTEPAPGDAPAFALRDLWLWLDRVWRVRCPACAGTGVYGGPDWNDPPDCEECDGRRWVFPVPDPLDADAVVVCGLPLDRNRLAWWLPAELESLGDLVRAWPCATAAVPAVTFDGEAWRVVVAGMDPKSHPGRYRTYHPGAGFWWQHRRDAVARLSAEDWFRDRGLELGQVDLFGATA